MLYFKPYVFLMLINIVILYILSAQLLSRKWHRICKQYKGKSIKECRNMACEKGKECPYNSLYNEKE